MSAEVRPKVREAALALFARKGVKATTIKDIAKEAGVSEGALYRHWASKEDLAVELFAAEYTALSGTLRDAAGSGPAPERLRRIFRAAFHLFEEDRDRARFLLLAQHDGLPLVPEGTGTPVDLIGAVVAEGIAAGSLVRADAEALAHVVIGAIVMNAQARVYGRQPRPLTDLADTIADAVLGGIAVSENGASPEGRS